MWHSLRVFLRSEQQTDKLGQLWLFAGCVSFSRPQVALSPALAPHRAQKTATQQAASSFTSIKPICRLSGGSSCTGRGAPQRSCIPLQMDPWKQSGIHQAGIHHVTGGRNAFSGSFSVFTPISRCINHDACSSSSSSRGERGGPQKRRCDSCWSCFEEMH